MSTGATTDQSATPSSVPPPGWQAEADDGRPNAAGAPNDDGGSVRADSPTARVGQAVDWTRRQPVPAKLAALGVAVAVVLVLLVSGAGGQSDSVGITGTWQRFVALVDKPSAQFTPSDGTAVASLLAPNSPACQANCGWPTNINIAAAAWPFSPEITNITVTGSSASATVGGGSTVQFAIQNGNWQISSLPG
jgi:hypothetical protein